MRIAVVHNAVADNAPLDERDVLVQRSCVVAALEQLGHAPVPFDCSLQLASLRRRIARVQPDCIFNLVESLDGTDALMHVAPSLFDAMAIPYTGTPSVGIYLSNNKLLAKERMKLAGLPTPDGFALGSEACDPVLLPDLESCRFIVKSVFEHGSRDIDASSLFRLRPDGRLPCEIIERVCNMGRPCLAERFIEGRELNVSLLAGADGPEVLSPSEIDFSALPAGAPTLVDYRAKWEEESPEYQGTPRRFDIADADHSLVAQLRALAIAVWNIFGLGGYARVDFRIDGDGRPWIIDVNANPCLSPDAGFAAALANDRIDFVSAVARILDAAMPRSFPRASFESCAVSTRCTDWSKEARMAESSSSIASMACHGGTSIPR